ncbi:MAG: putative bifunctional diguanylate cyclase/phosphodiesterase [Vicinamibacteria bacterium]
MTRPDRATGVWIGLTVLAALLVCAAVVTLHLFHNRALERSGELIRELRQARVDLAEGVLHATLGATPGSPWDRTQGEALLAQALAQFERSLARLPEDAASVQDVERRLAEFKALLAAGADARRDVELRAAFHDLVRAGVRLDAEAREALLDIRAGQDRLFLAVLAGSALLLALLVTGTILAARQQAAAERAAAAEAQRFERIFTGSPVATGIVALRDGRMLAMNDAACELYGASREALLASTVPQSGGWADDKQYANFLERLRAERRVTNYEMTLRRAGGELRECLVSAERVQFLGQPALLVILNDITERKRYEERIGYLATHDGLTGLGNRRLIEGHIAQAITHSRRSGRQTAVLFLDLDRFKVVNDGYGRSLGDALIRAAGRRLADAVREGDTVARLYGDEFLVLLSDLRRTADVYVVAQKLLDELARPVAIDGRRVQVTASIGVALHPVDGEAADALISHANAAMERAKAAGGNAYQFYTKDMGEAARRLVELETELRGALPAGQLELAYQPRVDLESRRIAGCEALLRWNHPRLGAVSPAVFVPVAEQSGLIVPIGEWVLRTACARAKSWADAGLPPVCVSVNLSIRQFAQQDVAALVLRVLKETGLAPAQLELEITESLIAQDTEKVIATVNRLKAAGVKLAIDDFGTGYSSLSYLKHFRAHALKIDMSFVRDMLADPDAAIICLAVISLAHSLRMTAVAEGVETAEQCEFLKENGCDGIQGYYFSRPVSAEAFEALLREDRRLEF